MLGEVVWVGRALCCGWELLRLGSFGRADAPSTNLDDLMSVFRPSSLRSENRPCTGRMKAGVFPTPLPETRLTGFTQGPHAYAQHVDNSVDNS